MENESYNPTTSSENYSQASIDSQALLEKFAFWLQDLSGCASNKIFSCISVDHSNYDVMACDYDHAFPTKSKCRQAAELRLGKAYHEAESKMEDYMKTFKENSIYNAFNRNFDKRLDTLKKYLHQLRNSETAFITDQMEGYLVASKIHEEAKRIVDQLFSEYSLHGIGNYTSVIRYNTDDPSRFEEGLAKLFAKGFIRYGFDCFDAICSIEEDVRDKLDEFQANFNAQIQHAILATIVEPIQTLLPQLSDAVRASAA